MRAQRAKTLPEEKPLRGVVKLTRDDRHYYHARSAAPPPLQPPSTLEGKFQLAKHSAAQLFESEGSNAWVQNGGAVMFAKSLASLKPKSIWIKRHIRRQRAKRRSLRADLLRHRAASFARGQGQQDPSDHQYLEEQAALEVRRARDQTPAAAGEWVIQAAPPASGEDYVTPPAGDRPLNPPAGDRRCPLVMRFRKKLRAFFEAERNKKKGENTVARRLFSTPPRPNLDKRVEEMRPTLESLPFEEAYSKRYGSPDLETSAEIKTTIAAEVSPVIEDEVIVVEYTKRAIPSIEETMSNWRRVMKEKADAKMKRDLMLARCKSLSLLYKAEENVKKARECLSHISQQHRQEEMKSILESIDLIKDKLTDDTLQEADF